MNIKEFAKAIVDVGVSSFFLGILLFLCYAFIQTSLSYSNPTDKWVALLESFIIIFFIMLLVDLLLRGIFETIDKLWKESNGGGEENE